MDFLQREDGQGLVEYALILVFIAIVVIAVLVLFGPALAEYYQLIVDMFP
jgi:pilus assembly protein Flp/PilA